MEAPAERPPHFGACPPDDPRPGAKCPVHDAQWWRRDPAAHCSCSEKRVRDRCRRGQLARVALQLKFRKDEREGRLMRIPAGAPGSGTPAQVRIVSGVARHRQPLVLGSGRRLPSGAPPPRRAGKRRASGEQRSGQDPGDSDGDHEPAGAPSAPARPRPDLVAAPPPGGPPRRSQASSRPSPRHSRPWRPQTEALYAELLAGTVPAPERPVAVFEQLALEEAA